MLIVPRTFTFPTRKREDSQRWTGPAAAAFYMDFKTRWMAMAGGYGSGKTYTGAAKMTVLAYVNHGQPGKGGVLRSLITQPTHGLIADNLIPTFDELLTLWGVPYEIVGTHNGWNLSLPEANHVLMLRSAKNPAHLKGPKVCAFWMDEAVHCSKMAFQVGDSRVRDVRARLMQTLATTTPEDLGWFYDRFGTGNFDKTRLVFAPTAENAQNLGDGYLDNLAMSYDPEAFRVFALGQFATMNHNAVYGDLFKRETHLTDDALRHGEPIFWCMDFNVDPMVACAIQERDGMGVVVDELVLRHTHTQEFAQEMRRLWPQHQFPEQLIYCDPAGVQRRTSAGGMTDIRILRDAGFKVEYRTVTSDRDAINELRARLLDTRRRIRLRVSRRCHRVISTLEAFSYVEGSMKTKHDEYARTDSLRHVPHMADALKYYAHTRFPITRPEARIHRGA